LFTINDGLVVITIDAFISGPEQGNSVQVHTAIVMINATV